MTANSLRMELEEFLIFDLGRHKLIPTNLTHPKPNLGFAILGLIWVSLRLNIKPDSNSVLRQMVTII